MRKERHQHAFTSLRLCTLCVFVGLAFSWVSLAHWLQLSPEVVSTNPRQINQQAANDDDPYPEGAPPVIGIREDVVTAGRTTEIVYATTSASTGQDIALLLHGCSHSALKFFSPSPSCSTCIGLSEEMQIARILVEQPSIAVVLAVTSQDRKSGCWGQQDTAHVQDAVEYIWKQVLELQTPQQPQHGRLWAFGASSGGRFAAQLAVEGIVQGAMVGVMSLGSALIKKWMQQSQPPIYLAPMPRDKRTLQGTLQDYSDMTRINNQNNLHKHAILDTDTCTPFPVTAVYLHQRVPHMTLIMAQQIVTELQTSGHMDATTGMLLKDPTKSDWRDILKATCGGECLHNQPLGPGVSPLAKALHRAWAFHEYCSEATLKALDFFHNAVS
ncbi:expressed unknown protein [Seminavis robusta]|uniref:Uncharacterized protein n=1 Tax=Seminavis robusta TaxID=568900 RepID=A0A9N8DEY5_9STRA|nr:expressed unknown protein [Seminavis robusta]|eukprot:Sro92_g047950.1 n/a (384) ;mRNA; r:13864-15015